MEQNLEQAYKKATSELVQYKIDHRSMVLAEFKRQRQYRSNKINEVNDQIQLDIKRLSRISATAASAYETTKTTKTYVNMIVTAEELRVKSNAMLSIMNACIPREDLLYMYLAIEDLEDQVKAAEVKLFVFKKLNFY